MIITGIVATEATVHAKADEASNRALVTITVEVNGCFIAKYRSTFMETMCAIDTAHKNLIALLVD